MGCPLDVVAVIVDNAIIALISQTVADQGKRGNAVKRDIASTVMVGFHNML